MEGDLLGLHLAVFHIDLVANEDDWDRLADARQILVPLGHIRVGDARAHIKHDDAALAANIVAITQTSEFLLAGSVPNVEHNLAVVREERHRVDLDSERGDVLLFKLASQVTLDEGRLANAAITDEDKLELWKLLLNHLKAKC